MGIDRPHILLPTVTALALLLASVTDAHAVTLRRSVFAGSGWAADRGLVAFGVTCDAIVGVSRAGSLTLWHGFLGPEVVAYVGVPAVLPTEPLLGAPYPNPSSTRLALPIGGAGGEPVSLLVFDVRGRRIRKLDVTRADGQPVAFWDLDDDTGRRVAAGLYFLQVDPLGRGTVRTVMVLP
jgi:hypothetical protein